MREIDVGNREGARNEGVVPGIELALDPIGPHPVEVVLDDAAVDESARMEDHPGPQQLDGLAHLGGLGEAVQARQQRDRIDKPMGPRHAAHQETPGQPLHPRHCSPPCSVSPVYLASARRAKRFR